MSPPGPVSGDDAQRAASELLRQAQYHRDDPNVLDRVVSWLGRHVAEAFDGTASGHALLIVVLLLGAVLVFAAVRAGRLPGRAARAGGIAIDPLAPSPATDHRRLAAELAARGDHAGAVREWLRAAVQTIEDRGVLAPRPGRTGSATAREAGPALPAAAGPLREATAVFDEIWFGGRSAHVDDVALAALAADAVRDARIARDAERPAPLYALPW